MQDASDTRGDGPIITCYLRDSGKLSQSRGTPFRLSYSCIRNHLNVAFSDLKFALTCLRQVIRLSYTQQVTATILLPIHHIPYLRHSPTHHIRFPHSSTPLYIPLPSPLHNIAITIDPSPPPSSSVHTLSLSSSPLAAP